MKDELTEQIRSRLAGHEMDAPPGVWEHVSGQLAAAASGEALRNVLQEKFRRHEVHVDPSAWANISGQLGHGAAAGSTMGLGWIAAGVAAVAITAGVVLWNGGTETKKAAETAAPIAATVTEPMVSTTPKAEVAITAPAVPSGTMVDVEPAERPEPPTHRAVPQQVNVVPPAGPQQKSVSAPLPALKESAASNDKAEASKTEVKVIATAPAEKPAPPSAKSEARPESMPSTASASTKPEEPGSTGTGNTESGNTAPDPFRTEERERIFIPNTFTPNGDDKNDNFGVTLQDYTKADLRIFSAKSGTLVFQTNDLSRKWDGRLPNGNFAEEGYYQCVVNWSDHEGRPHSENMTVRLFR